MNQLVRLAPVTRHNVGDILAVSEASRSIFYRLPQNLGEALKLVERAEVYRLGGKGDKYAAYETGAAMQLVGGGEISAHDGTPSIGYWVASGYRRQGFGRAIIHALEVQATTQFPEAEVLHAHIDPRNIGSVALAMHMGYVDTDETILGHMVYSKALPAENVA